MSRLFTYACLSLLAIFMLALPAAALTSAPIINSFAPISGKVGDKIVIAGTGLSGVNAVSFNGKTASFTVDSDTAVSAIVPSGATTGKIGVNAPSGSAISASVFTVTTPTINSFAPASGNVGDAVTITGSNFNGVTEVKFNGSNSVYTVNSATSISATVPASATTGKISVTASGGTGSSSTNFTVSLAPYITELAMSYGHFGSQLVISGGRFTGATAVHFNGTASVFAVERDGRIVATVPVGATTGKVTVTTPEGTATSLNDFIVRTVTITSFTPSGGSVGDSVTINFTTTFEFTPGDGIADLAFNYTQALFTRYGNQLTTTVPEGATTGRILIATYQGASAISITDFVVYYLPAITDFSPKSVHSGQTVTLTGTHFTGTTAVKFNGTSADFTIDSDTAITATVPSGVTTGKITVTSPGGTAESATNYSVIPFISSFAPTGGIAGNDVVISGSNFDGVTAVKFNGTPAFFRLDSETSISTIVPNGASTGAITLTYAGGTAFSESMFTVYQPITITAFTPTIGDAGCTVNITGTNFIGASNVTFNGKSAFFSVNNATSITTVVPSGATTGKITVTNPAGSTASTGNFTVYIPTTLEVTVTPGTGYTGSLGGMALDYSLTGPQTYSGVLAFDNTGKTTIGGLQPGTYSLNIAGSHWLKRMVAGINVNGVNSVKTSLTNGDADGGNSINLFDFVVLDSNFNTSNAMADLDGSGNVNLFDYVIIDQNFGALGD